MTSPIGPKVRLLVAAGLVVFSLGLGWAATAGSTGYTSPGYVMPGLCTSTYDGYLDCSPGTYQVGYYIPGTPAGAARGYEADARIALVPAAIALGWASRRRSRGSVLAVQASSAALAFVSVRAAVDGQTAGALVGLLAAALAASVAWPALTTRAGSRTTPRRTGSPSAAPTTF
ncbi:hypothetical protein KSP35_09460 [Aquihabitans sp. G128]|uniref:hypothetical protein n=1 Tax=Aquihabitans sp. G128 TaxID=2849779 RepID=UPI001C248FE2|nr:hypothetical protein [Aquihabitans sp. G128]QXC62984.1 hypothetical protein KSP35_09460 [Aquihabitans sp. G128]